MIFSTHIFYLLNLSTTPQFCPPLLLSYTFDVLNLIRRYNQPNTIRYLLCVIYYTLCTMHYALCIIYYALCTIYYALCIIYYALCTIHYTLYTIHYALYTMHYELCIMHYALFTMHYVFICIHTYLLFYTYSYIFTISHGKSVRNPVILVLTRSSRRVE